MAASPAQLANAPAPTLSTEEGISTEVKSSQPLKAPPPITLTAAVAGMETSYRAVQLLNNLPGISEKLFLRVRYFPPPGDIPVRKAFPGGIAAHPNSEV